MKSGNFNFLLLSKTPQVTHAFLCFHKLSFHQSSRTDSPSLNLHKKLIAQLEEQRKIDKWQLDVRESDWCKMAGDGVKWS